MADKTCKCIMWEDQGEKCDEYALNDQQQQSPKGEFTYQESNQEHTHFYYCMTPS